LNPGRPLSVAARAAFPRLRRVVLLAPSLAVLLLLAAAGAASAADPLGIGDTAPVLPVAPTVDPKAAVEAVTSGLKPVASPVVQASVEVLRGLPAEDAVTVVRRAQGDVADSVPPVTLPAVTLPDLVKAPDRFVQPRRPHAQAAQRATPPADVLFGIASSIVSDPASSPDADAASQLANNLLVTTRPILPLGLLGETGDAAFGGSGAGSGPWLGQGPLLPLGWDWRSAFQPLSPFVIPRGMTPPSLVPPG
jgi:hypothetical protein